MIVFTLENYIMLFVMMSCVPILLSILCNVLNCYLNYCWRKNKKHRRNKRRLQTSVTGFVCRSCDCIHCLRYFHWTRWLFREFYATPTRNCRKTGFFLQWKKKKRKIKNKPPPQTTTNNKVRTVFGNSYIWKSVQSTYFYNYSFIYRHLFFGNLFVLRVFVLRINWGVSQATKTFQNHNHSAALIKCLFCFDY